MVDLVEPTEIHSGPDYISTASGFYDMATGDARLTTRSLITHTDSVGAVTTLEGDSMIYTNALRRSEAYMSSNPALNPRPMVIIRRPIPAAQGILPRRHHFPSRRKGLYEDIQLRSEAGTDLEYR